MSDATHDAAGTVAGGEGRPDRDASATAPTDRIRVAAYAVIRDADGRFLLCHIAPSVGVGDVWTLPGGGVDFGESPAHAVLRELTEETGLTGELEDLVDVSDRLFGGTGDRLHAIRILYAVRITGGELRDERDGSTDTCRWVTAAGANGMRLGELARAAINRLDASHPETA